MDFPKINQTNKNDVSVSIMADLSYIGSPLAIAFTGQYKPGGRSFNFKNTLEKLQNYNKMLIRDLNFCWYLKGVHPYSKTPEGFTSLLLEVIKQVKCPKVTMIGVSMGGFASLLFGHLLDFDNVEVHDFSPQTKVMPGRIKKNHKQKASKVDGDFLESVKRFELKKLYGNKKYKKFCLYYGKDHEDDTSQAMEMKESVSLIPMDTDSHNTAQVFNKTKGLHKLFH